MVSGAGLLYTERTSGFASFQCSFIVLRVLSVELLGVDSDGGGGGARGAMEPANGGGGGIMYVGGGGGVAAAVPGTKHDADGWVIAVSSADNKSLKSKSRIFSWCN